MKDSSLCGYGNWITEGTVDSLILVRPEMAFVYFNLLKVNTFINYLTGSITFHGVTETLLFLSYTTILT